jgi:hypothetical protein
LPVLAKDEIINSTIQQRIGRVIFSYSTNNAINSPIGGTYGKHYETILNGKDQYFDFRKWYLMVYIGSNLIITVNMDKYNDTLYMFKEKIEALLNVRVEQEKRNAQLAFEKLANEMKEKLGFLIEVQFDWLFTEHPKFTSKPLDDQSKIIKQVITVHGPRVLTSNDG